MNEDVWTTIFTVRMTELRGFAAEQLPIHLMARAAYPVMGSTAPSLAAEHEFKRPRWPVVAAVPSRT